MRTNRWAAIALLAAAACAALFLSYPAAHRPPTADSVAAALERRGQEAGLSQLTGYDRDGLWALWGHPDVMFSGLWADIWNTQDGRGLYVGYGEGNCVEALQLLPQEK